MANAISIAVITKKALELLVFDKNGRKLLGYIIGITIFILLLPLIVICGLFGWMSGNNEVPIDSDYLLSFLTPEQIEQLEQLEQSSDFFIDTQIDTSEYVNPSVKNNLDLAAWAKAALNQRWGYVKGTCGKVLTDDVYQQKLDQYYNDIIPYDEYIRSHYIGRRTADCVGFIKGYAWLDTDTGNIIC